TRWGAAGIGCGRPFGSKDLQSRPGIAGADLGSQLFIVGWYGTHLSSSSFRCVFLQWGTRVRSPLLVLLRETERLQKGRSPASHRWHDRFVGTTSRRFTRVTSRLIINNVAPPVQLKVAALQQLLFE